MQKIYVILCAFVFNHLNGIDHLSKRDLSLAEKQLLCAVYESGLKMAPNLVRLEKTPDSSFMVKNLSAISQRNEKTPPGCFELYDAKKNELKRIKKFPFYLPFCKKFVNDLVLSPNGERLIVCMPSKTYVYEPASQKVKYMLPAVDIRPTISSDGTRMVLWQDGLVVREVTSGRLICQISCPAYNHDFSHISITPDNSEIVISCKLDLYVIDAQTGRIIKIYENLRSAEHPDTFNHYGQLKISPNGKLAVGMRADNTSFSEGDIILDAINLERGTRIALERFDHTFDLYEDFVCCVSLAITPDNNNVVVWPHGEGRARLFDLNTGKLIETSEHEPAEIIVDLAQDGTLVCHKP